MAAIRFIAARTITSDIKTMIILILDIATNDLDRAGIMVLHVHVTFAGTLQHDVIFILININVEGTAGVFRFYERFFAYILRSGTEFSTVAARNSEIINGNLLIIIGIDVTFFCADDNIVLINNDVIILIFVPVLKALLGC